jgi:hypothetical protein
MATRNKFLFDFLRGNRPSTQTSTQTNTTQTQTTQVPVTSAPNSSTPTTVVFWGYWKQSGEEITIPGATAAPSTQTGVTAAAQQTAGTPSAQTPANQIPVSQGSFLYQISPIGATGATS